MKPVPRGLRRRGACRRAGYYRLSRGNLARPGREQPSLGRRRSWGCGWSPPGRGPHLGAPSPRRPCPQVWAKNL